MHLFAYGSLMFEEVFEFVVGERRKNKTAKLSGFKRLLVIGELYPAIVPIDSETSQEQNRTIDGVVYFDIPESSWKVLDRFESRIYSRISVTCQCEEIAVPVEVYQWNRDPKLLAGEWSKTHFERYDLQQFLINNAGFRDLEADEHS